MFMWSFRALVRGAPNNSSFGGSRGWYFKAWGFGFRVFGSGSFSGFRANAQFRLALSTGHQALVNEIIFTNYKFMLAYKI